MAPVLRAMADRAEVKSIVCSTGQHAELLQPALDVFGIRPEIQLSAMRPHQSLASLTARLLDELDPVVANLRPDWILAQGDTTTVFAAALVSYYHRVRFGHVEAGLRTGDRFQPFPEEMNRTLADTVADLAFAPTERNRQALLAQGVPDARIRVTGNTVIDALRIAAELPYTPAPDLNSLLERAGRLVLVTAHRRENLGMPLERICAALRELADRFRADEIHFLYPVHRNPHVQRTTDECLKLVANVHLVEPLDYLALVHVLKRASLVLTDSGGLQEEAPAFGVPVLVLRDTTERREGVDAGVAQIVGTDSKAIVTAATRLLTDATALAAMRNRTNPYGDGRAAEKIAAAICESG